MALTTDDKQKVIATYRRGEPDTGSPEVQVALLTTRIAALTEHLKGHAKDHASRRGLMKLVGQRRRLLSWLHKTEAPRYQELIQRLGLRR